MPDMPKCPECGRPLPEWQTVRCCSTPTCDYVEDADVLVADLRRQLADAKAALSQAQLARLQASDLAARWGREILRLKDELSNQRGAYEAAVAEANAAREKAEAYLADSRELERLFTAALEHEKKIRGRAEAACAAATLVLRQAEPSVEALADKYPGGLPLAAAIRGFLHGKQPGQAILDERDRYRKGLEIIRDCFPCSCCDELGRCSRCEAVAALDEKETT